MTQALGTPPRKTDVRVQEAGSTSSVPWYEKAKTRDTVAAVLFVTPNAIMYTLFIIIPTIAGVLLGFYEWDLFNAPKWVGLKNYSRMFGDADLFNAFGNSLQYLLLGVIPTILIGFVLAVLVNTRMRGTGIVRTAYFVPLVVSSAVSAVLWASLYQPDVGLVNRMLKIVGIDGPVWLSDTNWALPALTLMLVWLSVPLVIILYLTALQKIPETIYEAASLDGAGMWVRLWQITWPNVSTMTMLVFAIQILNFLDGPVEISLIMTHGGPLSSTEPLSLYIYKLAFEQSDVGYAAAVAMFQFFVILAVGLILQRTTRIGQGRVL